jgi:transmembrane sensor
VKSNEIFSFFLFCLREKCFIADILYMERSNFRASLKKYLKGKASTQEKELIDAWYSNLGKEEGPALSSVEEMQLSKRYWSNISMYIRSRGKTGRGASVTWYSVALAVTAVLVLALYVNRGFGTADHHNANVHRKPVSFAGEKIVNEGEQAHPVTLPDGSKVTLEPRSQIEIATAFEGKERKVYLSGKAFFEVVRDESRPFKVCTKKVITKVLGTSFTVEAYDEDDEVTVSVKTGKVSVYAQGDNKPNSAVPEIILTPNQEFIYHKEERKVSRSIVKEPQLILSPEEVQRMRFEETAPNVVFEAIEKAYGVDLLFDESRFSSCRITTSISGGNILSRLRIICEVINADYRLEQDKIIIEGDGCKSVL